MNTDFQFQARDSVSVPVSTGADSHSMWMAELQTSVQNGTFKDAINNKTSSDDLTVKSAPSEVRTPLSDSQLQEKYRDVESNDLNRLALKLRTNPETYGEAADAYRELIRRSDAEFPSDKMQIATERLDKIQTALINGVDIKGENGIFHVDRNTPLTDMRRDFLHQVVTGSLHDLDDRVSYRMKLTDLYSKFAPEKIPALRLETKGIFDALSEPRIIKGEQKTMLDLIKLENQLLSEYVNSDPRMAPLTKRPDFWVNKSQDAIERFITRSEYFKNMPPYVAPQNTHTSDHQRRRTRTIIHKH